MPSLMTFEFTVCSCFVVHSGRHGRVISHEKADENVRVEGLHRLPLRNASAPASSISSMDNLTWVFDARKPLIRRLERLGVHTLIRPSPPDGACGTSRPCRVRLLNGSHFAVFRVGVRGFTCGTATGVIAAMCSGYFSASSRRWANILLTS